MIRYLSWILLLNMIFAVEVESKKKTKFTVTGIVLGKDGQGLKKVKISLMNEDGKKWIRIKPVAMESLSLKRSQQGLMYLKEFIKKKVKLKLTLP